MSLYNAGASVYAGAKILFQTYPDRFLRIAAEQPLTAETIVTFHRKVAMGDEPRIDVQPLDFCLSPCGPSVAFTDAGTEDIEFPLADFPSGNEDLLAYLIDLKAWLALHQPACRIYLITKSEPMFGSVNLDDVSAPGRTFGTPFVDRLRFSFDNLTDATFFKLRWM